MIVVPVKFKIYDFKMFYMVDFLLPITFKTLRNKKYVNRSSFFSNVATIGLQLYYKLIPVFSRFLITVQNQKRIQNPVKHLRWSVLLEYVLGFSR